jgi:hypothetical protein
MCEGKRFEGVGPDSEGEHELLRLRLTHRDGTGDRVHCEPDRGMNRGLEYLIGKRFAFSPDYRGGDLIGLIDTPFSETAGLSPGLYARRKACCSFTSSESRSRSAGVAIPSITAHVSREISASILSIGVILSSGEATASRVFK